MAVVKLSDYMSPTPRQKEAMDLLGGGGYVFYGGARGGGKSWMALASAVRTAMKYPNLSVVVIRKTFTELEDLYIRKLTETYPPDIFSYKYRARQKAAIFNNGSVIKFRSLETQNDAQKIQGLEYQLMIIDEAPNFSEHILKLLFASNRSAMKNDFVATVLMTGNPGGVSHLWFKNHFVDVDYSAWTEEELEQKEMFKFVPAKLWDNPYIDQEDYIRKLKIQDPNVLEAWLNGNWDVFAGQFFDSWDPEVHVVEPFKIPETWTIAGGLDLGFTDHPTVCLWGAQDPDGTIYVIDEYVEYGVAEQYIRDIKPIYDAFPQHIIWADPSIFDATKYRHDTDESVSNMFLRNNIVVMPANNNRVNGWRIVKQWLFHTPNKPPRLKIFSTCHNLIQTIPSLQYASRGGYSKEDLDTRQADDAVDALRYMLVSGFGYPDFLDVDIDLEGFRSLKGGDFTDDLPIETIQELDPIQEYDPSYNPVFVSLKSYYL